MVSKVSIDEHIWEAISSDTRGDFIAGGSFLTSFRFSGPIDRHGTTKNASEPPNHNGPLENSFATQTSDTAKFDINPSVDVGILDDRQEALLIHDDGVDVYERSIGFKNTANNVPSDLQDYGTATGIDQRYLLRDPIGYVLRDSYCYDLCGADRPVVSGDVQELVAQCLQGDNDGYGDNDGHNDTGIECPGEIRCWNTSKVRSLRRAFYNQHEFNERLDCWDVASVRDVAEAFRNAKSFNQPLDGWNAASLIEIYGMFQSASSFNQPIGSWNVSSVTDMNYLFHGAESFDQPIGNWDTSNVKMFFMTFYETPFNQPLDEWDVSGAGYMGRMFYNATSFNQPIGNWDTSSVYYLFDMFAFASSFDQPLEAWNTSSVDDISGMFMYASSFNQPLSKWDVSIVHSMSYMFAYATSFNQPLGNWNASYNWSATAMFQGATSFNQPLDEWNTSYVETMRSMFSGASLFNQNLDSWDTSRVLSMDEMFYNATAFNQCLSTWAKKSGKTSFFFTGDVGHTTLHGELWTELMFENSGCPNTTSARGTGPWCQNWREGCFGHRENFLDDDAIDDAEGILSDPEDLLSNADGAFHRWKTSLHLVGLALVSVLPALV